MFVKFFLRYCEVAVINEANKWSRNGAIEIARSHGYSLELLETPFAYDIGVLVRSDIAELERGNETRSGTSTGFHHGVLHCILYERNQLEADHRQKVHILATHLSPHSAARRRQEATALMKIIKSIEKREHTELQHPGGPSIVLAGDMNTLSPLDQSLHDDKLMRVLRANPRLWAKFFIEPRVDSIIDYQPMQILLEDLVDVAFERAHNNTIPQPTVPTAYHADDLHAAPMRLDYVLLNAQAVASIIDPFGHSIHIHTQIDEYTKSASDHYPLIVDLPSKHQMPVHNHSHPEAKDLPFPAGKKYRHPPSKEHRSNIAKTSPEASPSYSRGSNHRKRRRLSSHYKKESGHRLSSTR